MAMHLMLTGTTTTKAKTQYPESDLFFCFFLFFFHLPEQLYQIASTEGNMASK